MSVGVQLGILHSFTWEILREEVYIREEESIESSVLVITECDINVKCDCALGHTSQCN